MGGSYNRMRSRKPHKLYDDRQTYQSADVDPHVSICEVVLHALVNPITALHRGQSLLTLVDLLGRGAQSSTLISEECSLTEQLLCLGYQLGNSLSCHSGLQGVVHVEQPLGEDTSIVGAKALYSDKRWMDGCVSVR